MAIKIVGRDSRIEFIPTTEKGSDKPTTFYLRMETAETSIARAMLLASNAKSSGGMISNNSWADYFAARIIKIENVEEDGKIKNLESKGEIEAFLKGPFVNAYEVSMELLAFVNTGSQLSDKEIKN